MQDAFAVNARIESLRKSRLLSMEDLSEKTGIPVATIFRYCTTGPEATQLDPHRKIHVDRVKALAKVLGVSPEDIWESSLALNSGFPYSGEIPCKEGAFRSLIGGEIKKAVATIDAINPRDLAVEYFRLVGTATRLKSGVMVGVKADAKNQDCLHLVNHDGVVSILGARINNNADWEVLTDKGFVPLNGSILGLVVVAEWQAGSDFIEFNPSGLPIDPDR